jgi:protein SCO1/2
VKTRSKALLFLGIGVLAAGIGVGVNAWLPRSESPPEIAGFVYPEPRVMSPISLTADDGSAFTLSTLRGKWSFVYFGYTYCPDVCPTTLAELARVQLLLAQAGLDDDNQYFFVSVDPKRDTPQHLSKYVGYFNKKFIGVTGTHAALDKFTQEVGVTYSYPQGTDGDNYSVSHSSIVALFDPDARLHAVFTAPHKAETIVKGFRSLLDRWRKSIS